MDHVALMGFENTGFGIANDELLWIDPIEYRDEFRTFWEVQAMNEAPRKAKRAA